MKLKNTDDLVGVDSTDHSYRLQGCDDALDSLWRVNAGIAYIALQHKWRRTRTHKKVR
jgi:hypothetical protein